MKPIIGPASDAGSAVVFLQQDHFDRLGSVRKPVHCIDDLLVTPVGSECWACHALTIVSVASSMVISSGGIYVGSVTLSGAEVRPAERTMLAVVDCLLGEDWCAQAFPTEGLLR